MVGGRLKEPLAAPRFEELLARTDADRVVAILTHPEVKASIDGRYRHWDSLRHKQPPVGLSSEEWWLGIKLARKQLLEPTDLKDVHGRPFGIAMVGPMLAGLRHVDQHTSGRIAISEQVTNPDTRRSYLVNSLIEEAITSSQLEGATTSRRVAKEMLRSGRRPRNRSEQMIVNNYRAMHYVRRHRDDDLTPSMVLELHRIVTEGTLDDPSAAGRLQEPEDDRIGVYDDEDQLLHAPPAAEELPERLDEMCAFANRADEDDQFLHPVLRSIILHFWLGHDHSFEDGNGRTARALFYWSMLRRGYWLTEYLTISTILKKAPARYARSFLYTERDGNDLTYFALYQLEVVRRSIDGLNAYLKRKMKEVRSTERLLRDTDLNHRQVALLTHALRTPGATYTFRGHAASHAVVYQSARNDLLDLEQRGLLVKRKSGRAFLFFPTEGLVDRLTSL
jgi:Fic family protein